MPKLEAKDHINVLELQAAIFDTITFMKVYFFVIFPLLQDLFSILKNFLQSVELYSVSRILFYKWNVILLVEFYPVSKIL